MTARNSIRQSAPGKPTKPYPEFPLTAHPAGVWCKNTCGKIHYLTIPCYELAGSRHYIVEREARDASPRVYALVKWLLARASGKGP
jgi:hypothetical protein